MVYKLCGNNSLSFLMKGGFIFSPFPLIKIYDLFIAVYRRLIFDLKPKVN